MKTLKQSAGLLCAMLLAACQFKSSAASQVIVKGPNSEVTVSVEIADTPATREQGLMGRESLPEKTGMLFIMDQSQVLNFWMKNTLIPLDILFFDEQLRFVSAASMTPCTTDPCHVYSSGGSALYALEVPMGFKAQRQPLVSQSIRRLLSLKLTM